MLAERNWTLDHLLQAAGWDFERAVFVKDMAKLKKEPLVSMGHDRVLTVFSSTTRRCSSTCSRRSPR